MNGIFLQFELRFRIGVGRTLALQNFHVTHLIHADFFAKFCTTRNKINKEKIHFNLIFTLIHNSL